MKKIVVGVDGSDGARRSLAWAIEEAKLTGSEVLAVHAWAHPVFVGTIDMVIPAPSDFDFEKEAEMLLEREVKEVTGGDDDVHVERETTSKPPAFALVEASKDAAMLVVGSRGFGGFRGLLLGSVGQQCAQHAKCPVVIIPGPDRAKD